LHLGLNHNYFFCYILPFLLQPWSWGGRICIKYFGLNSNLSVGARVVLSEVGGNYTTSPIPILPPLSLEVAILLDLGGCICVNVHCHPLVGFSSLLYRFLVV
jgi:hypothetical protein